MESKIFEDGEVYVRVPLDLADRLTDMVGDVLDFVEELSGDGMERVAVLCTALEFFLAELPEDKGNAAIRSITRTMAASVDNARTVMDALAAHAA